jgi:hypothetical protein
MKNYLLKITPLLILGMLTILTIAGCSSDNNPVAAAEPQGTDNPYPVWTTQQIENDLIPGQQVLTLDTRAMGRDNNLDTRTSLFIRRTAGGTVANSNSGTTIGAWQLWEDRTVAVETPNPGYAIVDFFPHPYHFNGHVKIWIDLTYVTLPAGVRWDQLEMYYLAEDGTLQRYWGYVDTTARQYVAWTDHFSRYIISCPTSRSTE